MKTHICFIINPIAGLGIQKIDYQQILDFFDKNQYEICFKETQYSGHAKLLTKEAINEGCSIVVACGGDGTINEIASEIVEKDICLAFLPIGSGNGLATHLNIPKKVNDALQKIKEAHISYIDAGKVNDHYFFSNMGLGFDTQVLKTYKRIKNKPLYSYIKAVIKALFSYKSAPEVSVKLNSTSFSLHPFIFLVTNTNQMGYNISLHREASVEDGELNLIMIKNQPKYKLLWLGLLMILKKEKYFNGILNYPAKDITINQDCKLPYYLQKDGELLKIETPSLTVNVLDKALKVIC